MIKQIIWGIIALIAGVKSRQGFNESAGYPVIYLFHTNMGMGSHSHFRNSQVTYVGTSPASPVSHKCLGSGFRCVVSFTIGQLTFISPIPILNTQGLPQTIFATIYTRGTN